jgi:hypothetical protein
MVMLETRAPLDEASQGAQNRQGEKCCGHLFSAFLPAFSLRCIMTTPIKDGVSPPEDRAGDLCAY